NFIPTLKKNFHTLNGLIVFEKCYPFLIGGTPGGDGQIPWNVQTITNAIDFDMNPQQAVDAPRWTHTPGTDPATINQDPFLDLDLGMPTDIKEALSDLGHNVEVNDSGSFGGSAKMIKINRESGVISGGSDRRSDGLASAL
ncbi:MAG: gamma-glutamyltransferase, partial [Chloroflexota bacterium]|nr:gamma-glutamyltransferase [Chloroflexota bacterium]